VRDERREKMNGGDIEERKTIHQGGAVEENSNRRCNSSELDPQMDAETCKQPQIDDVPNRKDGEK
jgi:hypothetical protein